jgi:hypothetical protein
VKYLVVFVMSLGVAACSSTQSNSVMPGQPAAQLNAARRPLATGDFLGCPYPSGDVWQTDITNSPLSPASAKNIKATIDGGGNSPFAAGVIRTGPNNTTNQYVNMANNSTPMVAVRPKVKYHTPKSPEPWVFTPPFYIEPMANAHAMVLQTAACQYYETYSTTAKPKTHRLLAYSGTFVDLTQPFSRPAWGGCSTPACIPLGLLAVRPEELAAGAITHALGWDAVARSVSKTACVSPAAVALCTDNLKYAGPRAEAVNAMPAGAHIRLKKSFDISGFHPEAKIVAAALQQYGAYLFGTGEQSLIPFVNDVKGAPVWDANDDSDLHSISIDDFEVVQAP